MLWANDQYYELSGHPKPKTVHDKFSFMDMIVEEDQPKAQEAWDRLCAGESKVSLELRHKRLFTPPTGDPEPSTLLALAFPYVKDGVVESIMSCTIDVSSMKWAESWQARNASIARQQKRQQEEFIDVVSHEMRNPLSAM